MLVLILILMLAAFQVTLSDYLVNNPDYYQLDGSTWETDKFRQMALGEAVIQQTSLDPETIAALMVEYDYDLTDITEISPKSGPIRNRKPAAFQKLVNAYETVLSDLKFFPIPQSGSQEAGEVCYEDGWLEPRSYGGDRRHEGCDIMGTRQPSGFSAAIIWSTLSGFSGSKYRRSPVSKSVETVSGLLLTRMASQPCFFSVQTAWTEQ